MELVITLILQAIKKLPVDIIYYLSGIKTNIYHDKNCRLPKHFCCIYYIVTANACAGTGNRNQYKKQFS